MRSAKPFSSRPTFLGLVVILLAHAYSLANPSGVEVEATPPKTARPGEVVTHVFSITNTGAEDELFFLSLQVPEGWRFFPKQESIFVGAAKTGYIFVNLFIPPGALAGTYEISLIASASTDPTVKDTAATSVEVLPFRDLELRWMNLPADLQVGREAEWALVIVNRGNVPDVYSLKLTSFGDWEVRAEAEEVQLLPGERATVTLFAEVSSRAEPGAGYSLRVVATSIYDPTVSREITFSGHFLPPPPELVPRSLYPQWEVTLSTSLSSQGDPEFSFAGSGDIEDFGLHVDAALSADIGGLSEPRLSVIGKGKSFYLHGGTISNMFLGISGKPLFGGRIEGIGTWRALFAEKAKGISYTMQGEDLLLRFSSASSEETGLSFTDLVVSWGASEAVSLWGALSHAADGDGAGGAWRCGLEVSRNEWELSGTYTGISSGYPRKSPGTEIALSWDSSAEPVPFTLTYRFSSTLVGNPPATNISHELRSTFSPGSIPLHPRLSLGYTRRFDTQVPRTLDEHGVNFRLSLGERRGIPWNLSLSSSWSKDLVLGRVTWSLGLSGGFQVEKGGLRVSTDVGVSVAVADGIPEHSSSLRLRARFPGLLGEPSISFTATPQRTSFSFSANNVPAGDGEGDLRFTYALEEGRSSWDVEFSISFPADFPFLGPTRGRIYGRVFLDRDGDGSFGPGDKAIEGIPLEANGFQAISGASGNFAFPPLPPGVYTIEFVEPPPHLTPAEPLPTLEVKRGEEIAVDIPLRPRAWLKIVVFRDDDRDGERDPSEPGVPGVILVVLGPVERELETDSLGTVSLELPPGRYSVQLVKESLPARFVPTTPTQLEVEVLEFGTVEARFGAYQKPKPVVVTFAPPQAVISYRPERPKVGEPVEFNGTGSRAFGAEIVEYRWEFRLGDRRITAPGPVVTVAFPEPGDWTAILIVVDSQGRMGAARATVSVSP